MSETSVSSAGAASEKEARDVAEAARETEWENPSFVRELFLGRFRLDLIHPHPPADTAEEARAKPFMDKLRSFMERVDTEEIDRTGEIPDRKSTRLNSSHLVISYAVFCLKKKKTNYKDSIIISLVLLIPQYHQYLH